ncbi:MAG: TolC family protein [Lautropia sp.]|nr:TolC family protein [Lautropia sp.]
MTGRDPLLLEPPQRPGRRPLRALACAAALLGIQAIVSTAASAQTLGEAVAQALRTNPKVLGAQTAAQAVSYDITGAQSQMNTRFGLILEPGVGYVRGAGNNSAGDLGVQAIKPVYDSGRTDNEVARQRARLAGANQQWEVARAEIALQVADAYVEVVKQQNLAALAKDYVAGIASLNRRVEEIVKLDRGRGYDLLQTQSRLQQARLTQASREGTLLEAQTTLAQLVGRPVRQASEPPAPGSLPDSLEEALAALDRHPAVISGLADVEAARRAAAVAQAWDKPAFSLRGRVNSPEFPLGNRQWFGGYDVGVVTDWNPFDGGAGAARAAAAGAQVLAVEDETRATRRDLETAVARHWTQMQSRAARTSSLDELVEGARKVRAAYWEQFQIGKRSILDLLNAENETYQARLSAVTERIELLQVRYRLAGSLASLTGYLGIEPAVPVSEPSQAGQAPSPGTPGAPPLPVLR